MNKKIILIIISIIIIILLGGIIAHKQLFDTNTINIGHSEFKIPKGYHEGVKNQLDATNITNGTNTIFIYEYDDNDIIRHVNTYNNSEANQNRENNITNLTIDNLIIYKTDNINSNKTHYWFVKNNKTYDVYTWEKNNDMDSIVINLISS